MRKICCFLNENIEKVFISCCMAYFVVVTFLQVVFRFILKMPAAWTEETSKYVFIWMVYIGVSLSAKNGTHIKVDILEGMLHGRTKTALYWITQIIFLAFTLVMTIVGIEMVLTLSDKPQASPALKIPMQFVYASMPVGMGMCSFRLIQRAYKDVRNKRMDKEA